MTVKLKLEYAKADEIPEGFADLYTEKGDKFTLTGIEGLKTQADIDRQLQANQRERGDHKKTKDLLKKIAEQLDIEVDDPDALEAKLTELSEKLVRFEELNARGDKDGKLSDPEREELVNLRKEVGPLKIQITKLGKEKERLTASVATLEAERGQLSGTIRSTKIREAVRTEATKQKALPESMKHIERLALDALDVDAETGEITGKDNGISVADFVESLKDSDPIFWPASQGAGAKGGSANKFTGVENPWSSAGWNKTKQAEVRRAKGDAFASSLAASVGSTLGATKPPVAK